MQKPPAAQRAAHGFVAANLRQDNIIRVAQYATRAGRKTAPTRTRPPPREPLLFQTRSHTPTPTAAHPTNLRMPPESPPHVPAATLPQSHPACSHVVNPPHVPSRNLKPRYNTNPNEAEGNRAMTEPSKPLLTVEQQIDHMKAKGITFDLCTEADAAEHLRTKCQFFRAYAYRKAFPKYVEGERNGQYIGLDFGHLKALSNLDRKLRDVLLAMALDVEHFAKVGLLAAAENEGEGGHAIIRDYFASLTVGQRDHIKGELSRRRNDPYTGFVIRKYESDWPIWAFCEVVTFGTFIDLLKFCADRWGDKTLADFHYQLKNTKMVRNSGAHGACILNEIADTKLLSRPPATLVNAMTKYGIPKRLRSKWLRSRRMTQICSLFYLYSVLVPSGSVRADRSRALVELFNGTDKSGLPAENPCIAALAFLRRLTKSFELLQ